MRRFRTLKELHSAGLGDWTIFSFPSALADDRGLPPDEVIRNLLVELRRQTFTIDIWEVEELGSIIYWACRFDARTRVVAAIEVTLVKQGMTMNYLSEACERLFARTASY